MSTRRKAAILPHPARFTPTIRALLKRLDADRAKVTAWFAWRDAEIARLPECYERSKLQGGDEVRWLVVGLNHMDASVNAVVCAWARNAKWATEERVLRAVDEYAVMVAREFSLPDLRIATWLEPKGGKVIPIGRKRVKP